MAVSIAALAIGAGIAIYGAVEKNKAKKAAANNKMPSYEIPQSEYDNQRIMESQAGQGMSATSRQAYLNNADEGLSATTNAILRGGGDANSLGGAYDRYNTGIQNLSIYDDQRRQQHLDNLVAQNTRHTAMEDKRYQLNSYAPWANRAQQYAANIAGANQTMSQGIGIAGQGLTGLAGGIKFGGGGQQGTGAAIGQQGAGGSASGAIGGMMGGGGQSEYADNPATAGSNFTNNFGNGDSPNGKSYGWNGYLPMYQ